MHVFFYSIFVQFLQFLVLDFGLVHCGSDPFNSLSMGKVLVLNVYHSFEWMHHARSGSPLNDYQHLTTISLIP